MADVIRLMTLTFDLSTMELVCNVARGTDNLPANFGAYMTSRSSYGQRRVKGVKL